mmetsp:Transcript_9068/g.1335  ORF Transcript_9068/g.1335 Transcript_9068/m.1335 type:complete len:99 (+) Transcript_9068:1339-1635(+)
MVDVEVTRYVPVWFSFRIDYASDATWGIICGFLISGGLFSILLFSAAVLIAFIFFRYVRGLPNVLYRCIANFGIAMLFEPVVTFIQSVIIWGVEGDLN